MPNPSARGHGLNPHGRRPERRPHVRHPDIFNGETKPPDPVELLDLARLWGLSKQHAATAARFYLEAFTADPKLAADPRPHHRFDAACAAALAGCGRGRDAENLPDKVAFMFRRQALAWLRADLAVHTKSAAGAEAAAKEAVRQRLEHWQKDADLAGLRDPNALARLPQAECDAWNRLWAEVDALLAKARPAK
jgi:serine/threonine-protein kinase